MYKIFAICTVLLLIAVVNMPSGYYTFLRIAVTFGAVLASYNEYDKDINIWVIIFGLIAILYNPFIPIYFYYKGIWIYINIITAVLFGIQSYKHHNNKK